MSGGNNGKVLTVSRKLAKILTVSRKSHHPIETLLLGLRIFLIPNLVFSGVLLGGFCLLPPPKKKTFHVAAFSVFLIVSIFFNGIHPDFSFIFFFIPSAKRGDAGDMLVLPYYSDVNNANLDYVLK